MASSTREALLNAAWDAVVAGDWQRTRMADVAAVAGVSRQTLYNEFGTKEALAKALTLRETERFLDGIRDTVIATDPPTPTAAIRAAVEFTLTEAGYNPLLKAVLIDDAGLLPLLTTRAESLVALARQRMVSVLAERWPDVPADELELTAEMVTRLTVSYLILPSDHPDASPEAIAGRLAHLAARLTEVTA